MAFYDDLEAKLYRATVNSLSLIGHSDVVVFYANDNVLEPNKTYCIINIINLIQTGHVNESTFLTGATPTAESITYYAASIQYSITGKDARSVAPVFRHAVVNNRSCFMLFEEQGLGLMSRSEIRNIPQRRDTLWVPCFNFDVEMSFVLQTEQDMNWVDYAKINNEWYRTNPSLPDIN